MRISAPANNNMGVKVMRKQLIPVIAATVMLGSGVAFSAGNVALAQSTPSQSIVKQQNVPFEVFNDYSKIIISKVYKKAGNVYVNFRILHGGYQDNYLYPVPKKIFRTQLREGLHFVFPDRVFDRRNILTFGARKGWVAKGLEFVPSFNKDGRTMDITYTKDDALNYYYVSTELNNLTVQVDPSLYKGKDQFDFYVNTGGHIIGTTIDVPK